MAIPLDSNFYPYIRIILLKPSKFICSYVTLISWCVSEKQTISNSCTIGYNYSILFLILRILKWIISKTLSELGAGFNSMSPDISYMKNRNWTTKLNSADKACIVTVYLMSDFNNVIIHILLANRPRQTS